MAQWRTSTFQTDKRMTNDFKGGLNAGAPAVQIGDNQTTDEYGWETDQFPAIHTRHGRSAYGLTGGAQTNLLTNYGTSYLVRAVGSKLQYNSSGTTWTDILGTFADTDWDATNFNGKLLLTNGTDPVKSWDGATLSDLSANAPKGRYITNDNVRVWMAKDDILHYSGFQAQSDWVSAENSGNVEYYTPNGGDITGLRNFYGDKYVWKLDSFAVVQGTNYFNFRLREISNDIGCVSFKTIQEVGDSLFWLGRSDVYAFRGGVPQPIGQNIREYLDDVDIQYWGHCFAGTDGIKYYLGLVTHGNTQPNIILVFDPRHNIWRVYSLGEKFRYSTLFNKVWFMGNDVGFTLKMNDGSTDQGATINWMVTSKAFDEGIPEAEKEYFELHIQAFLAPDASVRVYIATDDRSDSFTLLDTHTTSNVAQNQNIIVPLDSVPITHYMRYKLEGTGEVSIYSVQRYFRLHPVQV